MAYGNLPSGVVKYIEAENGESVLFIVDGYNVIESQTEEVPL